MTKRGASKVRCYDCDSALHWVAARFAWVHSTPPADDHAPRPVVR
jgi:hypothetical protein